MVNGSRLALLSCLVVAPIFLTANADDLKIGYVNLQRALREAPSAIKSAKKVDQEFEKRRQELDRMSEDIKSRQAALSEKGSSLSEGERRAREAELAERSVRFQRRKREFQEDIKILEDAEMSAIIEKANKAIIQIAESEHLDMVLQDAVAVSKRVDITEMLIKKLTGD